MLKTIVLENFKSHQDTTIELDDSRLHAIVGKNSSGKTSILQALYYVSQLYENSISEVFKDQSSPEFLITSGHGQMIVMISIINLENLDEWELGCCIFTEDPNLLLITHNGNEHNYLQFVNEDSPNFHHALLKIDSEMLHQPFLPEIQHLAYLKLSTQKLSQAAYSEEIIPNIGYDGSNLAPTLDYIRNEHPEYFKQIEEMLKQVVPNVEKIHIKRAKVIVNRQRSIEVNGQFIPYEEKQEFAGQEVVLDMKTGERIPAHAISEGTMLTLGLLTVLMNPNQPNLVLLDDIEQGLHPKAQRKLIQVFKQIIEKNPNLQVIFTTHSPYIIDELQPSQVHVLGNDSSGFTLTQRLDEHPDIEWAIETLKTGEFWNAEGEDWIKIEEEN